MSTEKYNNQAVIAYLLGTLPEAETERFDELSFTDDDFAAALEAAEKDLIDAYVQGELSGETLETFESHYLASPLRREKVEFARTFQVFAKRTTGETSTENLVEKPASEHTKAGFFSALSNLFAGNKLLQFGFAAVLLFLISGGVWLIANRRAQPEIDTAVQKTPAPSRAKQIEEQKTVNNNSEKELAAVDGNALLPNSNKETVNKNAANRTAEPQKTPPKVSVATFVLAPPLRSGSQVPSFPISKEIASVVVRLQLESADYPAYRVSLSDASGNRNLWSSGSVRAQGKGENKTLSIQFPAKLLKSQVYSFVVSGVKDGDAEILTNYTFRAVIK